MNRSVVLLALIGAAGCGSGGGSGVTGSGGSSGSGGTAGSCVDSPNSCHDSCDPCTKLTDAQVTATVGIMVNPGSNASDSHTCEWEHDDSYGVPDLQIIFGANIHPASISCAPVSGGDAGITVTPLSGVGDEACYSQVQGLGVPELSFFKGCWAYSMTVTGMGITDATAEADEKTLALDALVNL